MLTSQQSQAVENILNLCKECSFNMPQYYREPFIYRVGGYAGTGKTYMLTHLRKELNTNWKNLSVAFVTFTGKASSVLKTKLEDSNSVFGQDYIGTIHSLIYKPLTLYDKVLKCHVIVGWELKDAEDVYYDLIIIDEGSMVSRDIWKDLLEIGKPILIVGDHGQLPPVDPNIGFNLMTNPDFELTEIRRQALDSPIIWLSKHIRERGYIPFNTVFSPDVFKISWNHQKSKDIWNSLEIDSELITLCAFNQTRQQLNEDVRNRLNYTNSTPYPGERIVCLKNNRETKLMNGQIGTVLLMMPEIKNAYRLTVDVDGVEDPIECFVHNICFGQVTYTMYDRTKGSETQKMYKYAIKKKYPGVDYFDYGYCISVHKSQGSEWNKVVLFEQRTKRWDDDYYARWLYTAVTRAKEKLCIISDYWG
jgi:exodeoxyribonuclease-5